MLRPFALFYGVKVKKRTPDPGVFGVKKTSQALYFETKPVEER